MKKHSILKKEVDIQKTITKSYAPINLWNLRKKQKKVIDIETIFFLCGKEKILKSFDIVSNKRLPKTLRKFNVSKKAQKKAHIDLDKLSSSLKFYLPLKINGNARIFTYSGLARYLISNKYNQFNGQTIIKLFKEKKRQNNGVYSTTLVLQKDSYKLLRTTLEIEVFRFMPYVSPDKLYFTLTKVIPPTNLKEDFVGEFNFNIELRFIISDKHLDKNENIIPIYQIETKKKKSIQKEKVIIEIKQQEDDDDDDDDDDNEN